MKGSEAFKITIEEYLKEKAKANLLFMQKFRNPDKNIEDCISYILNTVQNSGVNGFEDNEIFGMAMHYYDEKEIDIGGNNSNMHVVVNHEVKLTEEEKEELRKEARNQVIQEEKDKMRGKTKNTATVDKIDPPTAEQTLF
jgi:hypothetical protein